MGDSKTLDLSGNNNQAGDITHQVTEGAIQAYYDYFVKQAQQNYPDHPFALLVVNILSHLEHLALASHDEATNQMAADLKTACAAWEDEYYWKPLNIYFDQLHKEHERRLTGRIAKTESPIEEMFVKSMQHTGYEDEMEPQYVGFPPYRIDFAFPEYKVAVELDGHQWHSTKAARSRDAKRDRDLTMAGWTVLRFTGSDIYRHAKKCCNEVVFVLEQRAKLAEIPRVWPEITCPDDLDGGMTLPSYAAITWKLNTGRMK